MELKEFQEKTVELVEEIDKKYNMEHDNKFTILHILEELGEVAREIHNKETGRKEPDQENLEEEIADTFILLAKLAKNNNVDLEKAVQKKMQVLKERHEL